MEDTMDFQGDASSAEWVNILYKVPKAARTLVDVESSFIAKDPVYTHNVY